MKPLHSGPLIKEPLELPEVGLLPNANFQKDKEKLQSHSSSDPSMSVVIFDKDLSPKAF
jgi:hypothetical protein